MRVYAIGVQFFFLYNVQLRSADSGDRLTQLCSLDAQFSALYKFIGIRFNTCLSAVVAAVVNDVVINCCLCFDSEKKRTESKKQEQRKNSAENRMATE